MNKINNLALGELKLLNWAGKNINKYELVELVEDTIRLGPSFDGKEALYLVVRRDVSENILFALEVFLDWRAASFSPGTVESDDSIFLNSVLLDLVLSEIRKLKAFSDDSKGSAAEVKFSSPKLSPQSLRNKRGNDPDFGMG